MDGVETRRDPSIAIPAKKSAEHGRASKIDDRCRPAEEDPKRDTGYDSKLQEPSRDPRGKRRMIQRGREPILLEQTVGMDALGEGFPDQGVVGALREHDEQRTEHNANREQEPQPKSGALQKLERALEGQGPG